MRAAIHCNATDLYSADHHHHLINPSMRLDALCHSGLIDQIYKRLHQDDPSLTI